MVKLVEEEDVQEERMGELGGWRWRVRWIIPDAVSAGGAKPER